MKGTPGFVGERLREARESRGLTAIALSELLNVSRQAISSYESGESSPQPEMMQEIANKLNLPIAFFLRPIYIHNTNAVFFRSQSAANKLDRGRGNSRIKWLYEIVVPYLRKFVSLPQVNIPDANISNPLKLSNNDIENIANDVRKGWGLGDGPISNTVMLLENNGFIVTRIDLDSPALDAFSTFTLNMDGTPYVVLGADKQSAVRSRFDVGHELGHLVLHKKMHPDKLNNPVEFKIIEQQANRFSSALLVPRQKFAEDYSVPSLNAFQTLKYKWLVSIAVLIKRSFDLGFIPEEHYRKLWINYNQRGWRKEEPLDDKLPIEQPLLLPRACKIIIEAKVRTPEQLLAEIPLSSKDVEDLMYLRRGYLTPSSPLVELIDTPISGNEYKAAVEEVERIIKGF